MFPLYFFGMVIPIAVLFFLRLSPSHRLLRHKGLVPGIDWNETVNILTRVEVPLKLDGRTAEESVLPWVRVTASNLAVRSRFSTNIRTDGMLWRKADFSLWKLLMHGSEWCRNRQLPRRLECVSWRQKLLCCGCKFQCMTGEWCAISLHMGCGL